MPYKLTASRLHKIVLGWLRPLARRALGRRPKVDPDLARLIHDYTAAVAVAVALMEKSGIPRPSDPFEWALTRIPQKGTLVGGIGYFKHGFGCDVNLPSGAVDFDFREHGEIDGFDLDRMKFFARNVLPNYGFANDQALKDAFQAAVNSRAIVRRGSDTLYVLARGLPADANSSPDAPRREIGTMTPDLDIWRAAQFVVKRYGEDAAIQAGMRAAELLAEGDVDGAATWRAIVRAVAELQRIAPTTG